MALFCAAIIRDYVSNFKFSIHYHIQVISSAKSLISHLKYLLSFYYLKVYQVDQFKPVDITEEWAIANRHWYQEFWLIFTVLRYGCFQFIFSSQFFESFFYQVLWDHLKNPDYDWYMLIFILDTKLVKKQRQLSSTAIIQECCE